MRIPTWCMLSIFKTGIDGDTAKIKNLRQAERYLPDNIYDAMANFDKAEWTTKLFGEDVKARYAGLEEGGGRSLSAPAGHVCEGA